jgi:hypothetical protein
VCVSASPFVRELFDGVFLAIKGVFSACRAGRCQHLDVAIGEIALFEHLMGRSTQRREKNLGEQRWLNAMNWDVAGNDRDYQVDGDASITIF